MSKVAGLFHIYTMKSPTYIYHADGRAIIVDRCDVAAKHAEGWRESPGEAAQVQDEVTDSIDDLRAQAEAKGIKVDGRWSIARLQAEIEKAT